MNFIINLAFSDPLHLRLLAPTWGLKSHAQGHSHSHMIIHYSFVICPLDYKYKTTFVSHTLLMNFMTCKAY